MPILHTPSELLLPIYETVPRETIGIAWGVGVLRFGDMGDEECSAQSLSSDGNQYA
jgi:hypothetical protein